MSDHEFRQRYGIDPFSEWFRRILPGSKNGLVKIDLDYAIRRYGNHYDLDDFGDLMLVEKKEFIGRLTGGQIRIYGWLDTAIKKAFPERWRDWHLMKINYQEPFPICRECGQPIMDKEAAFRIFSTSKVSWDNMEITHHQLAKIIEGEKYGIDRISEYQMGLIDLSKG